MTIPEALTATGFILIIPVIVLGIFLGLESENDKWPIHNYLVAMEVLLGVAILVLWLSGIWLDVK